MPETGPRRCNGIVSSGKPWVVPAALTRAPRRLPRLSRRAALGAAVAGGAGVAAVRLFGSRIEDLVRWRAPTTAGEDWRSPLGRESARVAHLLRRTAFGATAAELERAMSDGYQKTLDRLLESKPAAPPDLTQANPGPRLNLAALQLWWVRHIMSTPTPFAERMTLFWHGHFTSDYRKVGLQTPFIYWQNLTWRQMGLTDLRSMLLEVTRDPAMLRYLDLATSTGANPNENYARELMELFTMGLHYSEGDVRAGARALAGWQQPRPDGTAAVTLDAGNGVMRRLPVWNRQTPGEFNARRAYHGPALTFLGRTGQWDTEAVIDQILRQPWTAPFIAGKLAGEFVSAPMDGAYVQRLASTFRSSKYDMKALLNAIFTSPEFTAGQSYRALVKNPTELMVHVLKVLNAPQLAELVVRSGQGMGQVLFDPPDVGGWPANQAWISSNSVVARVNFVTQALARLGPIVPPAKNAAALHLDGVLRPQTSGMLAKAADDTRRWFFVLASPEFQLK